MAPRTLSILLLIGTLQPSHAAAQGTACEANLPSHIRVMDCRLSTALEKGLGRAASLRGLVRRIGELHGIVYVSTPNWVTRGRKVVGGLSHNVANTGQALILQIAVLRERDYSDRALATLAHEFTHALEVLESPHARTERDVDLLFERIGYRQGGVLETVAAVKMGERVWKELSASRTSGPR